MQKHQVHPLTLVRSGAVGFVTLLGSLWLSVALSTVPPWVRFYLPPCTPLLAWFGWVGAYGRKAVRALLKEEAEQPAEHPKPPHKPEEIEESDDQLELFPPEPNHIGQDLRAYRMEVLP